jgi:hypothetical protein
MEGFGFSERSRATVILETNWLVEAEGRVLEFACLGYGKEKWSLPSRKNED